MHFLVGDIGGTKSTLAYFDSKAKSVTKQKIFLNKDFSSLEDVVESFVRDLEQRTTAACFAVAGAIQDQTVRLTNLPWLISAADLQRRFGYGNVRLLNDVEALAYAIPGYPSDGMQAWHQVDAEVRGVKAVIAVGTGLGESFLVPVDRGYCAFPSEGGHCTFAPREPVQVELLQWVWENLGHVSYESVCSGSALPRIHNFLSEKTAKVGGGETYSARHITDRARNGDPICHEAVQVFGDILAGKASDLAVTLLPYGGLYLCGGFLSKVAPLIDRKRFLSGYFRKGRLETTLRKIPVYFIDDPDLPVKGAIKYSISLQHETA
ncbi:MAG: glucokinase [Oligoflexales bacterium]